jgi:hypothetical protein
MRKFSTVLAGQKLGIREVDDGTMISAISTWSSGPCSHRQSVRHEIVTQVLGAFRS